jgi:hypothetical protein
MGNISQEQILTAEQQQEQIARFRNVIKYLKQKGEITGIPELAEILNESKDSINSWKKSPNKSGIPVRFIDKLCAKYQELNKGYLLPPFREDDSLIYQSGVELFSQSSEKEMQAMIEMIKFICTCTDYQAVSHMQYLGEGIISHPFPQIYEILFIAKNGKKFTLTWDQAKKLYLQTMNAVRLAFNGIVPDNNFAVDYETFFSTALITPLDTIWNKQNIDEKE